MRIRTLSIVLTATVIVLTAVSIGTSLFAYHLLEHRREARQNLMEAMTACAALLQGSDVLTDAVRGYAATGDEAFRSAFQTELHQTRSRDLALDRLRRLDLTPTELERLETAKRNSDALTRLENRIFATAARKDFPAAVALAWGPEYQQAKASILGPIQHARGDLETRLAGLADQFTQDSGRVKVVALVAYGLNFLAILLALGWFFQRRVIAPLGRITERTQRLMAGDTSVDFAHPDNIGEVRDLARALDDFRGSEAELLRQRWIKDAVVELVGEAQRAVDPGDFARRVLGRLAPLAGAGAGALFLQEAADGPLAFQGGYGLPAGLDLRLEPGSGLAGEALARGGLLVVEPLDAGHFRVLSTLGDSAPASVALVAFQAGEARGLLELACLTAPDEARRGLLEGLPGVLGPHLEILLRARRTEQLLESSRTQAAQLERSANQLHQANVHLNAIFESASFGIMLVVDRVIQHCNPRLEEILGWEPCGLAGQSMRAVYCSEAEYEAAGGPVYSALGAGQMHQREQLLARKDGTQVWVRLVAQALDPSAPYRGVVAMVEDITAEREGREALRAAAEEQRAIFDAASSGIVLVRDRLIVRCNHGMAEMFGHGPDGMVGQSTRAWYLDEATFNEVGAEIAGCLSRGETFCRDQLLVRKDGSTFWGRMSARAADKTDPAKGLVGLIEDITLARETADRLRTAHEEQTAILDTASSGIVLIKDRILQQGNRRLDEMFGYPPGGLHLQPTRIWYADEAGYAEGGGVVYEQIWRGETHRREQRLLRRDGSMFWARLTAHAVDAADPAKGSVWVIEDIDAEREGQERLKRAVAAAEAASQAKSAFLANMSHEIRTPMNAVLGYAQLLLRDAALGPAQREQVEVINRSGHHLLDLINDVLEMSKIEAGRARLDAKDFDFHLLLSDLATMFRVRMEEKGLAFTLDIDGTVPKTLRTDPMKVKQVLINVVGNALKFTDHGRVALTVGTEPDDEEGVRVVVEVADTGPGISEADQPRVFEAFEQAAGGAKKGGTGLGMAISRQFARLLGGDLTVRSRPGEGATFRFAFRPRPGDPERVEGRRRRREVTGLAPGSKVPHLLVVDDVAQNRDLLRLMLTGFGFRVDEALNGQEGLDRIAAERPDLVLMDWVMPVMNGLEATRRIKGDPALSGLPVVMLTASALEESRHKAGEAGVDGYLRKPVLLDELLDLIQACVPGVRYEYGEDTAPAAATPAPAGDPREAAARLQPDLRGALAELVEEGRVDDFTARVRAEVQPLEPALARHLELLAEQFNYRLILGVLE